MKLLLILALATAASGIKIECRYSWFTYVGTVIDSYHTCMVQSVDFSDNSTHITGANGTDSQLNMTKIIYFGWPLDVRCSEFNLSIVPQGGMEVFPNMVGLIFENCSINHLIGNELEDYPNLEIFMNYYSTIERIPGNFFDPAPNMQFITFWGVGLRHVGHNFMEGLNNLWNLRFYNNICISSSADNSTILINALVEAVRVQCPDNIPTEPPTTTEPEPTEPPRCEIDDMVDFVCRHDEEIEELKATVVDLQSQIDELRELLESKGNPQNKVPKKHNSLKGNTFLEGVKGKIIERGDETIVLEDDDHIKVFYTPKN